VAALDLAGAHVGLIQRFKQQRVKVFCILFAAYVGYYFCRVTLPVALPALESSFSFSKTETGFILSTYYVVYSFAKLINGFLGDSFGGRNMLLAGIFGSVLCNLLFGFGETRLFFVTVWGFNAYFQSIGWLAMISILAHWYPRHEGGRALGVMSLSYLLGDFVARSSAGVFLSYAPWPVVFWGHAAVLTCVGLGVFMFLRPLPEALGLPDVDAYERLNQSASQPDDRGGTPAAPVHSSAASLETSSRQDVEPKSEYIGHLRWMLRNQAFWVVCLLSLILSTIRYVFWGWSVQYLMERGAAIGAASLASAVFPLFGCAGTILAGWISDRMGGRRGPVLAVMCILLTLSIFAFGQVPNQDPVYLTVTLAFVGFSLYGPYSMLAGAIAMDFGSRFSSASAAGIIDAVGAFGTIITGVGMGYLIDHYGWNTAFLFVLGLTVLATFSSFALWKTGAIKTHRQAMT